MNWEIGIYIYTLSIHIYRIYIYTHTYTLCIKHITNENLLYSTGNSIQFSVITYMGKESEKEWIHVYA